MHKNAECIQGIPPSNEFIYKKRESIAHDNFCIVRSSRFLDLAPKAEWDAL